MSAHAPGNAGSPRPLSGLRVLDLTHALAGPYASMVLGDLGADIIKIEAAPGGDMTRVWGIPVGSDTTYHLAPNRNKRSVLLNYRKPGALELLRAMADKADVVLENFRPGAIEKMGLGYEELRRTNPRLIFGSISGFGRRGPKAADPGFDVLAQAVSGVMSINGDADGGPLRVGVPLGDIGAGMWLALGVVAAVRQRDLTGQGQRIDTSLLGTLLGMLSHHTQAYLAAATVPGRTGNAHPGIAPYDAFQCRDEMVVVALGSPSMWPDFCTAVGLEDLVDVKEFATPQSRCANVDLLKARIEQRFVTQDAAHWVERLTAAGIPAGPIHNVDKALEDPHVVQGGFIESIEHQELGPWKYVVSPLQMSSFAGEPTATRPPPRAGEHSTECLRELGIDDSWIERLIETGTLVQARAHARSQASAMS